MLQGYKTYIVSGAMVLYAIIVLGWQQNNWNSALEMILTALGISGLRSGVNSLGK